MDRFKFRIWDIKQQKYRQRTHHEADTCLDCLSGKVLYGEGIEIYGEENDKDVVLEQCTGLKDKNGKLIYENDLIKIEDDVAVIKWSDYYARFMLESSEDIFDFETTYAEECEVIGNIHENADLLGEDND